MVQSCFAVQSSVRAVGCMRMHRLWRSVRLLTKVFVLGGLFELDRRVPCAQLPLLCAASLERAAYLRGEQAQHHVFCVAGGSVAWRTRGRRVERIWNFSRYGRGGQGREQVLGTVAMTADCAARSGGAATRLSRMPKRTVVRGTRALARAACKTAQQSDRGCRWWQRKHAAAAAAAFFDALRGRD